MELNKSITLSLSNPDNTSFSVAEILVISSAPTESSAGSRLKIVGASVSRVTFTFGLTYGPWLPARSVAAAVIRFSSLASVTAFSK